jgi:hypothetical protein
MVCAPAPGLIRNPVPAATRIPEPAAVMIRPPIIVIDVRHPDISERPLISPVAVGSQLVFIVIELRRKIPFGDVLIVQRIPVFIPTIKVIAAVGNHSLGSQMPVGGNQIFPARDELGSCFAGGFRRPLQDRQFGLPVFSDVEPEEALFQDIE